MKEIMNISQNKQEIKKHAKNLIIGGSIFLSAMLPNKSEAQVSKDKEVVTITSPDDLTYKTYRDSLFAYKQGLVNMENAKKLLEDYSKKFNSPIKQGDKNNLTIEYALSTKLHGDADLHSHPYGEHEVYYDTKNKKDMTIEYENYLYKGLKPENLFHLQARTSSEKTGWDVENTDEFYPIFKEPMVQVVLDKSIKPIGKINIHGRDVEYYSTQELSEILEKLKSHNIIPIQVGDSNYTVSRFNETTKGWFEDALLDENGNVLLIN